MQLKQFLTDDRAVSPVIGVILMVAITVILAAVIGAFVLGLTDNVQSTPQAQFSFESGPDATSDSVSGPDIVNITHKGGDTIDAASIQVSVTTGDEDSWGSSGTDVDAGTTFSVADDNWNGATASASLPTSSGDLEGSTIRVIYDNPDSDKTATLAEYEVEG